MHETLSSIPSTEKGGIEGEMGGEEKGKKKRREGIFLPQWKCYGFTLLESWIPFAEFSSTRLENVSPRKANLKNSKRGAALSLASFSECSRKGPWKQAFLGTFSQWRN